jgi:hypothetical protein
MKNAKKNEMCLELSEMARTLRTFPPYNDDFDDVDDDDVEDDDNGSWGG